MPSLVCQYLAIALVAAIATLPQVDGYYYYYYYYYYYPVQTSYQQPGTYYTTPVRCSGRVYGTTCPVSSCYNSVNRYSCCTSYFVAGNGVVYETCTCNYGTVCSAAIPADGGTGAVPTTVAPTTAPTTAAPTAAPTTAAPITNTPTTAAAPTTTTTTAVPTTTTTRTTTTAPTTTTPFKSLCPQFRLLNGVTADQCTFTGISNITFDNGAGQICNAVYAPATVNGRQKLTFVIPRPCKLFIESLRAINQTIEIYIGKQVYPVEAPLFNLVDGTGDIAFIDINSRYAQLLSDLGDCQTQACVYNPATMSGQVNFQDCKTASYGASTDTLEKTGLHEAAVALNPAGCTNLPKVFNETNTMCFKTVSGKTLFCSGDTGGPVQCKANNGEYITVAVMAFHSACDYSEEFNAIPMPQ